MIRCPGCSILMRSFRSRGVSLDACVGCSAVWLDHDELEALLGHPMNAPQLAKETSVGCPRCTKRLHLAVVSSAREADPRELRAIACLDHGVFVARDVMKLWPGLLGAVSHGFHPGARDLGSMPGDVEKPIDAAPAGTSALETAGATLESVGFVIESIVFVLEIFN